MGPPTARPSFMVAKKQRLDRASFTVAYARGRRTHMPGLFSVHMPAAVFKAAAIVGKKVSKTAVGRNLLRRRMYAALSALKPRNAHIILVAKPPAASYTYERLETEIKTALASTVGVSRHPR
ncbi:ribonuclease P protein component [Candidatus Kaiserbacteria bacterium]|nr:ribonuclease P protein component [Candidatus Kaiserbacteria bacterium]